MRDSLLYESVVLQAMLADCGDTYALPNAVTADVAVDPAPQGINQGFTTLFDASDTGSHRLVASILAIPQTIGCEVFLVANAKTRKLAYLEMMSATSSLLPPLRRHLSIVRSFVRDVTPGNQPKTEDDKAAS